MNSRLNKSIFERSTADTVGVEQAEQLKIAHEKTGDITINNKVLDEIKFVIHSIRTGRLDIRADISNGNTENERELLLSFNNMLDELKSPLYAAAEYVDCISKGKVPEKVTKEYPGEFNIIKDKLNNCIDNLGGLLECSRVLKRMALNDFSLKVEGNYQGVYQEIADAVNLVREMLLKITDTNKSIARGDFAENLEALKKQGKRSEEDELMPSLLAVMENLNSLVKDTNMQVNATMEGRLDIRANAQNHNGVYGDIINGLNNTLDAIIKPWNAMAACLDRISQGDIPEKISSDFKGDFNEVRNTLNNCIDNLGGLVESCQVLQRIAENDYTVKVQGNYQGVYRETGEAVNLVRERLLAVMDINKCIAAGEFEEKLQDLKKMGKRSENDEMVPSLVTAMENLNSLVNDANMLVIAAVDGQLNTRADATRHNGVYRDVIEGLNQTLDALIAPLHVTAECIERISEGDIPEKVADEYRGDFKKIINNINMLIDSMNNITDTAYKISTGELTIEVDARSEKDRLMKSFQLMVKNLRDLAINLRDNSHNLASYAQELSANAEQTSTGAAQTAGSMAEVSTAVVQGAENAEKIRTAAIVVSDEAAKGQEDVEIIIKQMNDISQCTDNAAGVVHKLNSTSEKIGKIVDTISDIASQTNLLALNAAIEAARAGEHGRGFAVVAEEVRKLAEQSAKATEEIRDLIQSIQKESNVAVQVMNDSMDQVKSGVDAVNNAGKSFNQIIAQVSGLARQVDEIATGMEQTSAAIQNVTSITQESTAAMEEVASSTETLARLAVSLQKISAKFKVEAENAQ